MKNREHIGGRPQPHVPYHKLASCVAQPFDEPKLANVQSLSLRHRPDHRMERLLTRQRTDTADPRSESDQLVTSIGLHKIHSAGGDLRWKLQNGAESALPQP